MKLRTVVMLGAVAYGAYQTYKEMRVTRATAELVSPPIPGGI